jgi:hypothetical protein
MVLKAGVGAMDNLAAGSGFATADFPDGLSFPTSGPVFTLPAGFTANSVDANIVDNQLGGPPAVPAMTGWGRAFLGLVLAGLGLTGYRRFASVV